MFLYHYSTEIHRELLSKAVNGSLTPVQIKLARLEARDEGFEKWAYCDHISFFFEPIPSNLLPKLFKDHPFWVKGKKLYEHVVNASEFPLKIPYHVVESKKKTELYDKFSLDNNWVEDDPVLLQKWMILEDQKVRQWKEKGDSKAELLKQIAAHQGTIRHAYQEAVQRDDFEWNKTKYAANVPHLMLYPPEGRVKVSCIKSLRLGYDVRNDVITSSAL